MEFKMKVGDLVKCKFTDYGVGIITKKRPNGGFIVRFPAHPERYELFFGMGLAEKSIEVIA